MIAAAVGARLDGNVVTDLDEWRALDAALPSSRGSYDAAFTRTHDRRRRGWRR
jgi:hypothetical protein